RRQVKAVVAAEGIGLQIAPVIDQEPLGAIIQLDVLGNVWQQKSKWHKCLCIRCLGRIRLLCLPSNPSSPAFLKPYQPRRKDKSGKLLATIWQHLPGDIGLALRFKTGNLLYVVLVSLDGRSVASTCATNLCSNADRSSSARPDKITDVPNSAAIERPM